MTSQENRTVTIGDSTAQLQTPTEETTAPTSKEALITNVEVKGQVDPAASGVAHFDKIQIELTGENLTDDHFLTPQGLHWSDKSQVEIIKGQETGIMNDTSYWGNNNPASAVSTYSINNGDSGRVTYVGKTKSGLDLDLLWTVEDSDKDDWMANSGLATSGPAKGISFTGEQNIIGATGNSIVIFYNGANRLKLLYQIVEPDTLREVPVVLSFITTDIDAGQGVETDLANLTQIIPPTADLSEKDGIIYDNSPGPSGYGNVLNGSKDLPKGGYLGAGFLSRFHYTFYSPAPERTGIYAYATGVRYDIFGSALQAHMETKVKQNIRVNYLNTAGQSIRPSDYYSGLSDGQYLFTAPDIAGYTYQTSNSDVTKPNSPVVNFIYQGQYQVTFNYLDDKGKKLADSQTLTKNAGDKLTETAPSIAGYDTPQAYVAVVNGNLVHDFVYKKTQYPRTITLHFVDKKGRPLAPSEKQSALTETTFQYRPKSITGYVTPQAFEVKVDQDSSHTFIYQKVLVPRTIMLHFVDDKGQALAPSQRLVRNEEENLSYTAPSRENYVTPTPLVLTVDKDSSHTFVYQKIHRATFLYRDQDGRQVKDSEQVTGITGTKVSKSVEALAGYRSPASFETTLAGDVSHTFVYQKIYHVTFQYRDEEGKLLKNDETVSGIKGELAKKNPDLLWGYDRPVAVEFPITGDGVYTFTYRRKGGVVPIRPTAPAVSVPVRVQAQPVIPSSPAIIYRPQIRANTNWSIGRVQPTQPSINYPQAKPIQPAIKPAVPYKTESLWGREDTRIKNFAANTGLTEEDARKLINHLQKVEEYSYVASNGEKDKMKHAFANELTRPSYGLDKQQMFVNEFGTSPVLYNNFTLPQFKIKSKGVTLKDISGFDIYNFLKSAKLRDIETILQKNHGDSNSKIDLPHLAMPIATYGESSPPQEIVKFLMSLPMSGILKYSDRQLLSKFSPRDRFFQLNSLTGDILTHLSSNEPETDKDAFIFNYHPMFVGRFGREELLHYYGRSEADVNKDRERLYKEALFELTKDKNIDTNKLQRVLSLGLLGAPVIVGAFLYANWKRQKEEKNKNKVNEKPKNDRLPNVGTDTTSFVARAGMIGEKIIAGGKTIAKAVDNHLVQPAIQKVKRVSQAAQQFTGRVIQKTTQITQQVARKVQSIRQTIQRAVQKVAPIINRVVQPVKRAAKVVVRKATSVINRVIRPVQQVAKKAVMMVKNIFKPAPKKVGKKRR